MADGPAYRSIFAPDAALIGWIVAINGLEKVRQVLLADIETSSPGQVICLEDLDVLRRVAADAASYRLEAQLDQRATFPVPKPRSSRSSATAPQLLLDDQEAAGEEPWPPPPLPEMNVAPPLPESTPVTLRWYETDLWSAHVSNRVRAITEKDAAIHREGEPSVDETRERNRADLRDWVEDMRVWESRGAGWSNRLLPSLRVAPTFLEPVVGEKAVQSESTRAAWLADATRRFELLRRECEQRKATIAGWERGKEAWAERHAADRDKVSHLKSGYRDGTPEGIQAYLMAQLQVMPTPAWCPRLAPELHWSSADGILLIDAHLPHFPALRVEKWGKGERRKRVAATQKEARETINQLACFLLLRFAWEVVQADFEGLIQLVACNGLVKYDDPATGRPREDVIMSIAAKPSDLRTIVLDRVDPEACFRRLRGVVAPRVVDVVPVAPIIWFDKNDRRFIEGKEVLRGISGVNLASMDWQEFEHLIRELFEREYSGNGAEVRVTQASRDRGVDAVVFDPDPIKGGKIIIQAKRYSATVELSAVRDLYGTIQAEGANKGILVTTSDFGADAYDFAVGKPLTLLSGANLLHLLRKHGYDARIDLGEARALLREKGGFDSGPHRAESS